MKILTAWLRAYLPDLPVSDRQLADDLTLRGIAVEGVHDLGLHPAGEPIGHLFEMDITTNRVDAMNHYGIAREAATIYNLPLAPLEASLPAAHPASSPFSVRIAPEAESLCGRFTARVLRNVHITPSIGTIAEYFSLLGQKLISNAVDDSNFTLLDMGHPTHAFDLDTIEGGLVLRLALPGERLTLLDGTTRTLEPDDLVIADERKALSLAGVMGGLDSSITARTRNILVESAWFDPASIRRSSRRHLLHTDASHRFERGADFNAAPLANSLVSRLILSSGSDSYVEGDLIDLINPEIQARTARRPPISLSIQEVQRHLGATLEDRPAISGDVTSAGSPRRSALTSELIQQYLSALGCMLAQSFADTLSVHLPSWRLDLEREIDLIEEVARVFGYNRFSNTLPMPRPVLAHPTAAQQSAVRSRLLALGYSETLSSTFASVAEAAVFFAPPSAAAEQADPPASPVPLENPLSEEASLLRPSLLPGMLAMLAGNLNRDVRELRLFEQGHIFTTTASAVASIDAVHETPTLALGVTSAAPQPRPPLQIAADTPIYELKGAIESILSLFELPGGPEALSVQAVDSLSSQTSSVPTWIEPGRGGVALLHRRPIAFFGELARAEQARRKLRQPVFLATIDLTELLSLPLRRHTARELSRFQAVDRDFSFVFPDSTQWHIVAATIHALALPELTQLSPVEVWRDPNKYPNVYSLLLRTIFQSATRTLTEADLAHASTRIIEALTALGGTHRA